LKEERRLILFENRVLRRIFGPKRDEVTGEWRRLHNEELNNVYSSPNIIQVIKSRRMRRAGHGRKKRLWWGDLREGVYLEYLGVDGRIILSWIFKKWYREAWIGLIWLRIGTCGGCL
jgi:hypothetical protein